MTTRSRPIAAALAAAAAALTSACFGGGTVPPIRYYALSPPAAVARGGSAPSIAVEELRADSPYDERRIVYRTSRYQLAYYEYEEWSAAPGSLVADYLRRAYQASGQFGLVLAEPAAETTAILGGRILAFEEGDAKAGRPSARVMLDLELRDAETGRILWTRRAEQELQLARRSPEDLAAALSRALGQVATATAAEIAAAIES